AATLRGRRPAAVVAAASDAIARAAQDLELALGEGPAVTAMTADVPVRAVGGSLPDRWPLYGPAIGELGVRAVVAGPLRSAAARGGRSRRVSSPLQGGWRTGYRTPCCCPRRIQPLTETFATSRCSARATTRRSSIRRRAWWRCSAAAQSMTRNACSGRERLR